MQIRKGRLGPIEMEVEGCCRKKKGVWVKAATFGSKLPPGFVFVFLTDDFNVLQMILLFHL